MDSSSVVNAFGYSMRGELLNGHMDTTTYGYAYDAIGRRAGSGSTSQAVPYAASGHNRYTHIATQASTSNAYGLDLHDSLHGTDTIGDHLSGICNESSMVAFYAYDATIYDYDRFDRTTEASGPLASANPWRFSIKQVDDWGLYYYGHRFYSADIGRWVSRDPIGERGGLGVYKFVGNESPNSYDALGLLSSAKYVAGIPALMTSDGFGYQYRFRGQTKDEVVLQVVEATVQYTCLDIFDEVHSCTVEAQFPEYFKLDQTGEGGTWIVNNDQHGFHANYPLATYCGCVCTCCKKATFEVKMKFKLYHGDISVTPLPAGSTGGLISGGGITRSQKVTKCDGTTTDVTSQMSGDWGMTYSGTGTVGEKAQSVSVAHDYQGVFEWFECKGCLKNANPAHPDYN